MFVKHIHEVLAKNERRIGKEWMEIIEGIHTVYIDTILDFVTYVIVVANAMLDRPLIMGWVAVKNRWTHPQKLVIAMGTRRLGSIFLPKILYTS
jgi:hypothetical protein